VSRCSGRHPRFGSTSILRFASPSLRAPGMVFAPHPWAPLVRARFCDDPVQPLIFRSRSASPSIAGTGRSTIWCRPRFRNQSRSPVEQFYNELSTFAGIALVAVVVGVMTRFFVSHYIFRWRTAMTTSTWRTGRNCAPSRAPRSACRKTPCGLRPPRKVSAST